MDQTIQSMSSLVRVGHPSHVEHHGVGVDCDGDGAVGSQPGLEQGLVLREGEAASHGGADLRGERN